MSTFDLNLLKWATERQAPVIEAIIKSGTNQAAADALGVSRRTVARTRSTVTQHFTLAARDAYTARGGWFSDRQVKALTYHDQWGLVASNVIIPEMLISQEQAT